MDKVERYFADQLKSIAEIREIIKAMKPEFEALESNIYKVLNSLFLIDLDEDGCTRYEKMLGIEMSPDDTLEDRRFRILALYKGDTPYTIVSLRRKLEELCGAENVEITLDEANYSIKILIGLASKNRFDAAYGIITKMLPCNISLDYSLKYNQHMTLGKYTHAQLAALTHEQLRSYVITIGD